MLNATLVNATLDEQVVNNQPGSNKRTGKQLLIASRRFAREDRGRSWRELALTAGLFLIAEIVACSSSSLWLGIAASLLVGLLSVRMFIIYHDFMHGAILQNSKPAAAILKLFGLMILSPPKLWKHNHDTHHRNNCKSFGAELGEFPVMTTTDYENASFWQRLGYRIVRNPLIILFGYFTSFLLNKPLYGFLTRPIRDCEGALALALHFGTAVILAMISLQALLLGMVVPVLFSTCVGTYLFYAQHNFPGIKRRDGEEWDYVEAALRSSSFMRMSPLMHWFTGNIGYHHVHHLNSKIPFYRLPEAMAEIEELQTPIATSLNPVDVYRCLQLKLWDPDEQRLLTFREAKIQLARARAA